MDREMNFWFIKMKSMARVIPIRSQPRKNGPTLGKGLIHNKTTLLSSLRLWEEISKIFTPPHLSIYQKFPSQERCCWQGQPGWQRRAQNSPEDVPGLGTQGGEDKGQVWDRGSASDVWASGAGLLVVPQHGSAHLLLRACLSLWCAYRHAEGDLKAWAPRTSFINLPCMYLTGTGRTPSMREALPLP